jgi:hypothetical protein
VSLTILLGILISQRLSRPPDVDIIEIANTKKLMKKLSVLLIVHCSSLYQYSKTNVMHFLFILLRIKGLYMFRTLLAHVQEALHNRHLVYCVPVMSVGCHQDWSGTEFNSNPVFLCRIPPCRLPKKAETCSRLAI